MDNNKVLDFQMETTKRNASEILSELYRKHGEKLHDL